MVHQQINSFSSVSVVITQNIHTKLPTNGKIFLTLYPYFLKWVSYVCESSYVSRGARFSLDTSRTPHTGMVFLPCESSGVSPGARSWWSTCHTQHIEMASRRCGSSCAWLGVRSSWSLSRTQYSGRALPTLPRPGGGVPVPLSARLWPSSFLPTGNTYHLK